MTPQEIKAVVDSVVAEKVLLTYPQLFLFVLLSGIAAYIGAYLKQKGQNLASREDIQDLTKKVEAIKISFSKQVEDYKAELAQRSRVAEVAEFFTEWISPSADFAKLNGYAMRLSLWLPNEIYRDIGRCICYEAGAANPKQILVNVRKYILGDKAGDLKAENIIHFQPNKTPSS